ncbi:G protein-coupled receptor [Aphelenchoides bicaudatus]|nr:G protein-coupled receptor [Aphelenchoides bicaudatus]
MYIPCLFLVHKHSVNDSVYALLRYLAVVDMLSLQICAVLTGILTIRGEVFCSNSDLIYLAGAVGLGLYGSTLLTTILLVFNRCAELLDARVNQIAFSPNMMNFWMVALSIYGAIFTFFTVPIKFNSIYPSWFLSPYPGYEEKVDDTYSNLLYFFSTTIEASALIALYMFFCNVYVIFFTAEQVKEAANTVKRNFQVRTFVQVYLISMFTVFSCVMSVSTSYVPPSKGYAVVAQFFWIFMHGVPAVLYFALNRTLQRELPNMIRSCWNYFTGGSKAKVAVDANRIG